MFKNPFGSAGRIRRLEYGISYIIYFVYLSFLTLILDGTGLVKDGDTLAEVLILYFALSPGLWFIITQGAKRCHDRNNSGWWQVIPFYGFWMLFAPGDIGRNDYGVNPKALYYDLKDDDGPEQFTRERTDPTPIDDVDEYGIIKMQKP